MCCVARLYPPHPRPAGSVGIQSIPSVQATLRIPPEVPLRFTHRSCLALWLTAGSSLGCQPTSARIAHRGGAAYWPENSRTAVEGSLKRRWDAVHFDVFLTQDRRPVLNAEPFLDATLCRTVGDRPIEEVWLLETSFDVLHAGYRCGGVADPQHPGARRVEDTIVPLEVLIDALETRAPSDRPEVHLTAGFFPNVSHDPAVYAAEVLGRWSLSTLDAPPVIVADLPLTLDAFRADARARGLRLQTTLIWPRMPAAGGEGWAAAGQALGVANGLVDPLAALEASGADGIRLDPDVATRTDARRVAGVATHVEVGPVHTHTAVRAVATWPVDAVLTSDPEL